MNQNSEKEYLILKKKSYQSELKDTERDITLDIMWGFASALVVVNALTQGANTDTLLDTFATVVAPCVSSVTGVLSVKSIANNIAKKAKYQIRIEDLDKGIEELNMEGNEKKI